MTDPELPGASPTVLGVSIWCFRSICSSFVAVPCPRRSRFRLARYEDAISQMGAKCDRGGSGIWDWSRDL